MKDGMIVESGSHGELMSVAGEYAKLYKIQAQAFSEGQADSTAGGYPLSKWKEAVDWDENL